MSTQKHILRLGVHLFELREVSKGLFMWVSTHGMSEGSLFTDEDTAINWARERVRSFGEQGGLLLRDKNSKETS